MFKDVRLNDDIVKPRHRVPSEVESRRCRQLYRATHYRRKSDDPSLSEFDSLVFGTKFAVLALDECIHHEVVAECPEVALIKFDTQVPNAVRSRDPSMFGLPSHHPGPRSTVGPLYQINLTFEWVGPSQPLQGIVTALLGTGTASLSIRTKPSACFLPLQTIHLTSLVIN